MNMVCLLVSGWDAGKGLGKYPLAWKYMDRFCSVASVPIPLLSLPPSRI